MFHAHLVNSRCLIIPGPLVECRAGHLILDQVFAQVQKPNSVWFWCRTGINSYLPWWAGCWVETLFWLQEKNSGATAEVNPPSQSLWGSLNSFGEEISLTWPTSDTTLKTRGISAWGILQHQGFIVGSPAERSSKGWAVAGGGEEMPALSMIASKKSGSHGDVQQMCGGASLVIIWLGV